MSGTSSARCQTPSPAVSLWNQRRWIAATKHDIEALSDAIGEKSDFSTYQWMQILALAVEFQPDLIVELGRRFGNSTCCFLEAANRLGGAQRCRVLSLDVKDHWPSETMPRIANLRSRDWFGPAEIVLGDILDYDFASAIDHSQRCLLFWDAHGFEIAQCVFGSILPRLAERPHVVLMHDISDRRFEVSGTEYGSSQLWSGRSAAAEYMWLGDRVSSVAQLISAIDFTTRNGIPFHSAVESFYRDLNEQQRQEIETLLGKSCITQAHWHWFSLNEASGPITFPAWQRSSLDRVDELSRVHAQNQRLQQTLQTMQNSAGWRTLETLRGLRDRVAPAGSVRRKLVDKVRNLLPKSG